MAYLCERHYPQAIKQLEKKVAEKPVFAQFLVEKGINSISINPDTVIAKTLSILEREKALQKSAKK